MTLLGGVLVLLIGLAIGFYFIILDWEGRPFCHKQIHIGIRTWMEDTITNAFPNVIGAGSASLIAISNSMGGDMKWTKNYNYVPGLREGDPGELVLMYFAEPTRWTWHGSHPTIFKGKAWIVVPVDFTMSWPQRKISGELSERVSTDEFKTRLKRTLDFVRTNERPHWQAVVAEHKKFLDSIEHAGR